MVSTIVLIILHWIHIVTVVAWGGGAILITFNVMPNLGKLPPKDAGPVAGAISKQFTKFAWTMVAFIALTGILRMYYLKMLSVNYLLNNSLGQILTVKLLIFLVMIVLGTQILTTGIKLESASGPEEAMMLQGRISLISKAMITLGIIVIFLAVGIRHGGF